MSFWLVMLLMMLIVIGASVLVGVMLTRRPRRSERQRRQMDQAKAAGAFPHRKESQ
ncbi:MAG: hypothetical protein NW206_17715 [Hyphomonadaceae bacterium]|nr:hypothetical protein [Hyphomonadaceae bacterium]